MGEGFHLVNNERAKSLDIVFNRGLRQDLNPQTAPIGTLLDCDNLEFDQLGRLVRRDGFVSLGTTGITGLASIAGQVRRTAQCQDGTRLIFSDENLRSYLPSQNKISSAGLQGPYFAQRAGLVSSAGIASDQLGGFSFLDSVAVGQWIVYLYIQTDASGSHVVCVDAVDSLSGARVFSHQVLGTAAGTYPPRLVVAGGSSVVFALWEKVGGTVIEYAKCDFASQPFTWSAAADLVTTSGPTVFDAAPMQSGWVLVYYDSSVLHGFLKLYSSTLTVVASNGWSNHAGGNWTPTALAISGDTIGGGAKVHTVGYDPATFKLETAVWAPNNLGFIAGSNLDPGLDHAKHVRQLAIAHTSSTASLIAFSNYTSTTVSANPRGHLYMYTMDNTAVAAAATGGGVYPNYSLASRIIASDVFLLLARFDDPSGAQSHFLLLDCGGGTDVLGTNFGALSIPLCHLASGRVPLFADNAITGLSGLADLSSVQSGLFQISAVINIGANAIEGNQIQTWNFETRGRKRFLSTQCQGEVVVGGGTPLVFDGQRLVELSYYSYPILALANITTANAGGSIAQGIYQYRCVFEWCDTQGNRHQSPASPAVSVDMSGAGFAGGTNQVTLKVPYIWSTRKQFGFSTSDGFNVVRMVFYRTTVGSAGPFYRVPGGAANQNGTANMSSFLDTFADASISGNEVLYEKAGGQGLLSSTAPPATLTLTTHSGRLWGVDLENPERIWCTRGLQQGSAPAYNPALQILIPGAGRINGLGGQDGNLYALATNGIYLASYGDGPDDTGGGGFPSPQLITTTANCTDPRGVLVGQEGIFFVGKDQWGTGIYLLPRGDGQPRSIGKRVRTELAARPVCRGIVNRTSKARTEFLFVDNDISPTSGVLLYYHHDYLDEEGVGQWSTGRIWDGAANEPIECIGVWDDVTVIADEAGRIGWQTPGTIDDMGLSTPLIAIGTTDIRPFGLVGYGKVESVTLLGTAKTADNIELQASYDSGATFADSVLYPTTTETAGQPLLRQWQPPTAKLPNGGSIRLRVTDQLNVSAPGTTYFHGLSLRVMPLGGDALLDNARRA